MKVVLLGEMSRIEGGVRSTVTPLLEAELDRLPAMSKALTEM